MLLAEGRLALEDGAYRPVGDLTSLAVPETLTALIASRLDGLAADDRALVSDAAVLGQSFTLAGLSAVVRDRPRPSSSRACGRSSAASSSRSRPTRARPERGQYAFVQALIREVAYNTLAQRGPQDAAISPRPASSSPSRPTSSPAPWPATTSRPTERG